MKIIGQTTITLILAMLFALPASASSLPMDGYSFGGKVRSGPGTNYQQTGSLAKGASVVIVEDARVLMNGYSWFKVSDRNGRVGYQWGGLLCSKKAYNGISRKCASGVNITSLQAPGVNIKGLSVSGGQGSGVNITSLQAPGVNITGLSVSGN